LVKIAWSLVDCLETADIIADLTYIEKVMDGADYQGLTRGFRHGKIFCSSITARLVKLRIGVPSDRIQALPLNETVLIDGIRVTFIDANHCPGSVMILFEPPNGKVRFRAKRALL
jgi:hypothetical protein